MGAPAVRVLVGEQPSDDPRPLRFLGLGGETAVRIPADERGRMIASSLAAELAKGEGPAIVCAQSGKVNTGSCDDPLRGDRRRLPPNTAPGFMSTARSASGPRRARHSTT